MEPDYENFSLKELLQVKEKIDRGKYPERYVEIANQINKRLEQPKCLKECEKSKLHSTVIFIKFIMGFCGLFYSFKLYISFNTGI